MLQILLTDRDQDFRRGVLESWTLPDSELSEAGGPDQFAEMLEARAFDLAFVDVSCLWRDGMDLISFARRRRPELEIVALADSESLPEARAALERGACQYLVKPLTARELMDAARRRTGQILSTRAHRGLETHVLEDLLGNGPAMQKILRMVRKIAPTTSTVLITGESGTGKEFLANVVHRLSPRCDAPFVAVNCGAIPETLVESELFGARKGAYTGAAADRKGLFEEADGGTLFLDEVGELPPPAQVKLLRFLQNREVRRVGDSETRTIDARVLAATNMDLQKAVVEGRFREDLFFRLNVFHLQLPPLRERPEAMPHLVRFFVRKWNQAHGRQVLGFAPDAEEAMVHYPWPGNVRELENAIEHAVVLCEGDKIRLADLPETLQSPTAATFLALPPSREVAEDETLLTLSELERRHILRVLAAVHDNQSEAAHRLGISRSTLWRKLREMGMEDESKGDA